MKVVELRPEPSLQDIPGMMRQLADLIEVGEVEASAVLCIVHHPSHKWPEAYGWGEHLGDLGNIGLCEMAKNFFVNNRTSS